jgi:hypothetical protein
VTEAQQRPWIQRVAPEQRRRRESWAMMERDELIAKMRNRVEQCRRLANAISSPVARKTLLDMAEEGEADIRKLEEAAGRNED